MQTGVLKEYMDSVVVWAYHHAAVTIKAYTDMKLFESITLQIGLLKAYTYSEIVGRYHNAIMYNEGICGQGSDLRVSPCKHV